MHSAGGWPNDVLRECRRRCVLEQDVVADKAVNRTKRYGVVKRLHGLQQLLCNLLRWECELAEGRHYGVVRAASSALVRRVV